jgi:hypothetical protein
LAGTIAALARGAIWPVALLALPPAFYVWSMHSSLGTPIFVPDLWPNSYYNSRYGLALLPLCALGVAALATFVPRRWCVAGALSLILAAISPWLIHPREDACITWKESQVNSVARGEWTRRIAGFMRRYYRPGSGIFTTFGDRTAVFRQAGIPLRETLTWDNGPAWYGAVARPDLMLFEEWAIAEGGDPVQTSINRALRRGPHYELVDTVIVKGAPVFEIYRRALTSEP